MTRYAWKAGPAPGHLELIDNVSRTAVAIAILGDDRKWHWKRYTTRLLHGAPPAEGFCRTAREVKQTVLTGLPDAPAG